MSQAGSGLPAALTEAAPGAVVTDPQVLAGYVTDWTGRFRGSCRAVLRPADEAELARLLAVCDTHRARVVLQGGNTGLVGGAVPGPDDVLVSLRGLDTVEQVDPVTATAVVQAGVTLADLQRAARPAGLELAVDLGARDSATVGGMAATNAGGIRALADGSMRAHVLALDALDVGGRQLARLKPLVKDNTGLAVGCLLVGSEGQLGVITRLLLRLVPVAAERAVALVGFADLDPVLAAVATVRRRLAGLRAAELMDRATLELVQEAAGLPAPLPGRPAFVLLLEAAGDRGTADRLGEALADVPGLDPDAVTLAGDAAGVRQLWAYRDGATEAVGSRGTPHKLDVTLPSAGLAAFHRQLMDLLAGHRQARPYIWGHVGDGNLHINLLGLPDEDDSVDAAVLRLVAGAGGSISAEHGIGRAKAAFLPLARTREEIAAMARLKAALDPDGRLGVPLLAAAGAALPTRTVTAPVTPS